MRTFRKKYFSYIDVDEAIYKADFQILDKYQGVSAEIVRLSLAGIAIYGFMLSNVVLKQETKAAALETFKHDHNLFNAGILCLLAATACSLAHKHFSTDCMTHHIRGLRSKEKWNTVTKLARERDLDIYAACAVYEKSELDLVPDELLTDDQVVFLCQYTKDQIQNENRSLEFDITSSNYLFFAAAITLVGGIGLTFYSLYLLVIG